MTKTIIVFAPHPDDETFGCGGTIAKRVREGYEVLVVVLTDGRYAFLEELGIDSDPTPEELKEIRKEELKRVVKILGVREENLFFLDFEDGTLDKNEEKAEEKVMEILSKNSPVEVYFPYEKDCHPDHCATNRIVRNSIKELGLPTRMYKYSILRRYARVGPLIDALLNLFRRNMIRVDISEFLSLKVEAANELESMVSITSSNQIKPVLCARVVKKLLKREETFFIDKKNMRKHQLRFQLWLRRRGKG